tara:strand:+ start:1518 stop:2612 length:1095 start_codon:yes stop_codon:yes gene_type:complete
MGLGDFLKKIALPVAGIALGGPILGALGGIGGGAAAGGLGGLIGGFQTSGLGQALGLGLKGVSLFSSFQQGQSQIEQAQLANRIQSQNTLEAINLFEIKQRAFKAEEAALVSGSELQAEQLSESRLRIQRSLGFGESALGRRTLELGEKFRQLDKQESALLGTASAQAASRGVRVQSESVKLQRENIAGEVGFARDQLTLQRGELEQQQLELQQQFEDAIFDADMQQKINLRNDALAQERIDFEREVNVEREKTARQMAALQGIPIPGDSPDTETPEEKIDRERRQREEAARMRGNIDPTISQPGGPTYGGQFFQANVFGQNISGFAGTTSDFGSGGGFNPQTGQGGGYFGGSSFDPFGDYGNE